MNLFQLGKVTLSSGQPSDFKIDCDALTNDDIACIAFLLSKQLPPFGSVEGVPRGGLRLAAAMEKYVTEGPLLIVDDVLTTGRSMERQRAGRLAMGAVIFTRESIHPAWIASLLRMGGGFPMVKKGSE